jgi:hypothetical protein
VRNASKASTKVFKGFDAQCLFWLGDGEDTGVYHETPVYRLNWHNFAIEKIETTGDKLVIENRNKYISLVRKSL